MARDYRVFINQECLGILPLSGRRRQTVIHFFRQLSSMAHLGGDFYRTDSESFRQYEVRHIAGYAVTWWIDGPVFEVKGADVRPLSKR